MLRPGDRTVKLKLNKAGREQMKSCEPRQIRITGDGAKQVKFDLRRNTATCRPKPIDLSRAETCDFIALDDGASAQDSLCMLPFPDDLHTVAQRGSATGSAGRLRRGGDAAQRPRRPRSRPRTTT